MAWFGVLLCGFLGLGYGRVGGLSGFPGLRWVSRFWVHGFLVCGCDLLRILGLRGV